MRAAMRAVSLLLLLTVLWTVAVADDSDQGEFNSLTEDRQEQVIAQQKEAQQGAYDPMTSRITPNNVQHYAITQERLRVIRERLMYPYYDMDQHGGNGDLQENINAHNTQINKQLTFLLPFFGFGLNYTWVSVNGYIGFSNAPFAYSSYPLTFPVPDWPKLPDPSFIGPFYSKCNIGSLKSGEPDQQRPGVYWRLERDLPSREDQMAVELRERIKWDVREGIVGAEIFNPKHLIIVTWKNVTFSGGYANSGSKRVTNTFQLLVVTDEVRSYAIFNYEKMSWTSHTEAGGSADDGQGGTPAFVGFNAGNGTRAFEYVPYSQSLYIRDLKTAGRANGIPGRHIFRMDEVILPGCCRREENMKYYPLTFSPEHANMLGGTLVNVTGPCFETGYRVTCQFDTTTVEGKVIDSNTAVCITPRLYVSGYVVFSISVNGEAYYWRGRFFIETPLTAPEGVWFTDKKYRLKQVESFDIQWLSGNLTQTMGVQADIHLYGYRERTITPEIIYIDELAIGVSNDNRERNPLTITPKDYANNDNDDLLDLEMGMILIKLSQPEPLYGLSEPTLVWSRPIPLAWYFNYQWERKYGSGWPVSMCDRWIESDRNLRNFAYEAERCPCLLQQAIHDRGRFLPDFSCDQMGNHECDYHFGAIHCVRTALPNKDGAGQQCCYDRDGYLMMTADKMWGGNPHRAHNLGMTPFDEANKVPSLSHWFYDVIPFYTCCKWQSEQSPGCINFRFERRASQDCVGYQVPGVATVFGDPHFYTYDDTQYTFNGKGEFVLTRVESVRNVLDVQGRFQQIEENYLGGAKGSMLTAVAAKDNISSVVEVRRRAPDAMWRYHLDVIVDGRRVYFDRYAQKIQQFKECVVYTPSNILNQSQVVIMFASGAGVEVQENNGFLGMRVFLPLEFANTTKGLFGNWTFFMEDDFVMPDGTLGPFYEGNNFKTLHEEFGLQWVLDDKEDEMRGKSLFTHDSSRSSNYYYDANFVPEYEKFPVLSENATTKPGEVQRVCGDSYQCNFDFVVTLRRDFAVMTKYYQDQFVNIKQSSLQPVISCGAIPTPPHGRKSTFNFLSGAEVKFDCDPGYVLLGEQRRWCYSSGDWNWPEDGEATCVSEREYLSMKQGIVTGTVLAILIPVVIALGCFVCHLRASRQEDEYENGGHRSNSFQLDAAKKPYSSSTRSNESGYSTAKVAHPPEESRVERQQDRLVQGRSNSPAHPTAPPPRYNSQSSYDSESAGDDDSLNNAPSSYDGEYETNEPIDNKPVNFQNVLWEIPPRKQQAAESVV